MATWYCLHCGSVASDAWPSLDALHPLVFCQHPTRPCGRVPGTADRDELAAARTWAAEQALAKRHRRHLTLEGHLVASCRLCREASARGAATRV